MRAFRTTPLLAIGALMLVTAGCVEEGSTSKDAGGSVEYGASAAEWQAAFADVGPITLRTQMTYPEGNPGNQFQQDFVDTVTELSGDKITFDVAYSNAVAPGTEAFAAVVDGRIDLGLQPPATMAQEFPVSLAWNSAGATVPSGAFPGVVHTHSVLIDAMLNDPAVLEEFEAYGLHLLHPFVSASYPTGLLCREAFSGPDDLDGRNMLVMTPEQATQGEALGMNPVSLPYTDWFSALERGVGDCVSMGINSAVSYGIVDVAPHVVLDDQLFLGPLTSGAWAINKDVWDGLPLVAQQLLHDQVSSMLAPAMEEAQIDRVVEALELIDVNPEAELQQPDAAMVAVIDEYRAGVVDEVAAQDILDFDAESLAGRLEELSTKWTGIIDGLGYPRITYADLVSDWEAADIDLEPWTQTISEEILRDHRPS